MKSMLIVSLLLVANLGFAFEERTLVMDENYNESNAAQLIYEVRLNIAAGTSVWTDYFSARGSNPLKVTIGLESACPRSPGMNVSVRHSDTQQWELAKYDGQYDNYSGGLIDGLQFQITQPWYAKMTCTFRVYANSEVVQPTTEKLVGAIQYVGGFGDSVYDFNPSQIVKKFRIEIPSFCNVQVLQAMTTTEGVKDSAQLVDAKKNIFTVNNGAGSRISRITASLNGPPATTSCFLPVYIQ